jgi:RNA polymerase sigma factor (sigma-70 family)
MCSEIASPDAPLNTCPAAFLTGQASLIAELHAQAGGARWGVPPGDFAGALYRSAVRHFDGAPPEGDALGTYLRGLHLADLALACALQLGSETAWEDFVVRFRPALYSAARAIAASRGEAHARELADALYGELYGLDRDASGRRRSLLQYFHGRSKLLTWLRTVLAQRHVDSLRAGRNMDSLEDEVPDSGTGQKRGRMPTALFITSGPSGPSGPSGARETGDPDRARLLPRLQETLLAAFEALAPSDRLLLAMYYLDQQTLAQIARMRGVHEATVSRQLERIRRELRESVEGALAAGDAPQNGTVVRKGLSAAEIDLCLQYAVEDGCFDLSQALSRNKQHTAIQQPKPAVAEQDDKN